MELVRVTPPAAAISLDEARVHLRLDTEGSPPVHEEDDLITQIIAAAIGDLDGADGWLGRALVTQTWKLLLPRFPEGSGSSAAICLPLTSAIAVTSPPAAVVDSVVYVAPDGTETTLAASNYRVLSEAEPNIVEPIYSTSWPATRETRHAVAITYQAGYGDAAAVPDDIKAYLKIQIGQLYEHREAVLAGTVISPVPYYRDSLENYRLRGWWAR